MNVEMFRSREWCDERVVAEYRLTIVPDGGLRASLDQAAAYGQAQYLDRAKWVDRPMLELLRFRARPDMEDTLLRWMRRICGQSTAFALEFNNYGSRPDLPLYLRVADATGLKTLGASFRLLDGWLKSNGMDPVNLSALHRLPLVQQLDAEAALAFLLDFSARSLHARLHVEELVLQKSTGSVVSRLPLAPARL